LRYYKKHFAPQNIYILDHDSVNGATTGLDVSVTQVHNPLYNDHQWMTDTVRHMQAKLLEQYRYVLFTDSDEMVVADPAQFPGGLSEYILQNKTPIVRCDGRCVVQNLSEEKDAIDWGRPVFEQRRWWYYEPMDCKTLLANQQVGWGWGFHYDSDLITQIRIDRPIDPFLYMVHLHRADLKTMLDRHAWMRKQPFRPDGQGDAGRHQKWSDEEIMANMQECQTRMRPIPRRFNGSIL
jgi:hypothetical protein